MVLPLCRPPIENGAVCLSGNRIRTVSRWTDVRSEPGHVLDLGESILMPGLVNAHCHLDYTDMRGKIPPQKSFADWIKSIVPLKADWGFSDYASSWLRGAEMLLRTGTTTVADIECVPELLPDLWDATPLRIHSFHELIHLQDSPQAEDAVQSFTHSTGILRHPRSRIGLSPHAPYSTTKTLLAAAVRASRELPCQLTTHVSESEQEFEMFMYRHGPLFDWLKSQRNMTDCGLGSPIHYLDSCGYLQPNLLAVHVNYLWRDDAKTLARRGVSVAHCPSSHAYFKHLHFPYDELARAHVNICLGTDSLASTRIPSRAKLPELSMFTELQTLARARPALHPSTLLRMATINAAQALGFGTQLGQLQPDALADLIALPYKGPIANTTEAALHHSGPVSASFIDGVPAFPSAEH